MKRAFYFVAAMLVAAPLFFASCEKEVKSTEIPAPVIQSGKVVLKVAARIDGELQSVPDGGKVIFSVEGKDILSPEKIKTFELNLAGVKGEVGIDLPAAPGGTTYEVSFAEVVKKVDDKLHKFVVTSLGSVDVQPGLTTYELVKYEDGGVWDF